MVLLNHATCVIEDLTFSHLRFNEETDAELVHGDPRAPKLSHGRLRHPIQTRARHGQHRRVRHSATLAHHTGYKRVGGTWGTQRVQCVKKNLTFN